MITNLYKPRNLFQHKTPHKKQQETIANVATNKQSRRQSAVYDSGATSHCGRQGDDFEPTEELSHKVFHLPNGDTAKASTRAKLHLKLRDPARTVDMVPDLKHNSLISASKFADANYITVLTPTEVLIYDGERLKLEINKEAVLRGWRDSETGLWRVPLNPDTPNLQSEYVLFPEETTDVINNVYELPSSKEAICRLPNQDDMAESDSCWELFHLAKPHCKSCYEALPRV